MTVMEEIDSKLSGLFGISTSPMSAGCVDLKLELLGNLLLLYDETWQLKGCRLVMGNIQVGQLGEGPTLGNERAASVKRLKKWLKAADLGHLVSGNLVEGKRFCRLVTGLMDKVERRHGGEGKLRSKVLHFVMSAIINFTTQNYCQGKGVSSEGNEE